MMDEVTLTLWSCVKFEQGTISVRMASHVVDPGELSGGGANLPALMAHKELITRGGIFASRPRINPTVFPQEAYALIWLIAIAAESRSRDLQSLKPFMEEYSC